MVGSQLDMNEIIGKNLHPRKIHNTLVPLEIKKLLK